MKRIGVYVSLALLLAQLVTAWAPKARAAWWWCSNSGTPSPTPTPLAAVPTAVATAGAVWTKSTGASTSTVECVVDCVNSTSVGTPPPGWFPVSADIAYSSGQHGYLFCHADYQGSSEPATTTFGAGQSLCGMLITNAFPAMDLAGTNTTTAATTAPAVASQTTNTNGDLMVVGECLANNASNSDWTSLGSGVTLAAHKGGVAGVSVGCAIGYFVQTTAGATGAKTGAVSTTADVGSAIAALIPGVF